MWNVRVEVSLGSGPTVDRLKWDLVFVPPNCESESRSTVVLKITIVYIDGEYGRQGGGISVHIWSGCEFIVTITAKK